MHEHKECKHKIEYCKKCRVAYCTKCKKEWSGSLQRADSGTGGTITTPISPFYYVGNNPNDPTVLCSETDFPPKVT